jgi:hypothetical protein
LLRVFFFYRKRVSSSGEQRPCRKKSKFISVALTRMAKCPARSLRVIRMRSPRGHSAWRWQPRGLLGDLITLSPQQTMHPLTLALSTSPFLMASAWSLHTLGSCFVLNNFIWNFPL